MNNDLYNSLKDIIGNITFIANNISVITYYNSDKATISIDGVNSYGKVNKHIVTTKQAVENYTGKDLVAMINNNQITKSINGVITKIEFDGPYDDKSIYYLSDGDKDYSCSFVVLNNFSNKPKKNDKVSFDIDRFGIVRVINFKESESTLTVRELFMNIGKNIIDFVKGK